MFRIFHYRNKCIGCNACVEISPWRWRVSTRDGKSVLIGAKKHGADIYSAFLPDEELTSSKRIVESCPVRIIKID